MKTLALHWCVYLFFVFLGPREKRRVLSLSLHLTWMDTRLGSNTENMCFLLQMDTTEDLFFLLFLLSYTVDCAVHRTVGFFFVFFKQSTEYLVMRTDHHRTSFMKIQNRHVFQVHRVCVIIRIMWVWSFTVWQIFRRIWTLVTSWHLCDATVFWTSDPGHFQYLSYVIIIIIFYILYL